MTRYRLRAVLMLFLLLNLTACYTYQVVATTSPAGVIEAKRPDRVRVLVPGGIQVELENPLVEGDQLLGTNGIALPLADVLMLETPEFSKIRTIGLVFLSLFVGVPLLVFSAGE